MFSSLIVGGNVLRRALAGRKEKGARYKIILHCRETPPCLSRSNHFPVVT
jgi:hypothetical protein